MANDGRRFAGTGSERQATAVEALGVAVAARVPVLLWGAPGTGKTSAIRAMADALGWPCETVIASIREPSDFAGLPVVVGDGVRFAPPAWARRLAEAGRGLLFLDELSTAPPAVQAALLRVVLERVVGDLELPPEVAVVAAANPPEQAADGWDLSAPLANRLCHLSWEVDPRAVADGLAGGWAPPGSRSSPAAGGPNSAWPSPWWPRSCTSARRWRAPRRPTRARPGGAGPARGPGRWPPGCGRRAAPPGPARNRGPPWFAARWARAPGVEFLAWVAEMDLPDPEAVLADPGVFLLPPAATGPTQRWRRSPRW